ncbi:MAG TPA: cob(I)yrinic acid a,c-diamide adenosyltransferase [Candidatus Polarisedimenticolaceae bacterium]|nr:cob(I)yrinic acid a,c-diamide adenosyltransferase [Candidatus Polarisedimenticolaceae bacterium]
MAKITKIYTRSGDDGTTGLGTGRRVAKDTARIEAYGAVDELNAALGVALAVGLDAELERELVSIQNDLFHLGSDLCIPEADKEKTPVPRIEQRHVDALEALLDRLTAEVGPLENFILPGGTVGAAQLHVARTVCRSAERKLVTLVRDEPVGPWTLRYLNRLSDALFVMARFENLRKRVPDLLWDSRR